MAMQYLENELRRTGDPRKQAFADVIAGIHKSLGSDIPFPVNGATRQAEAKTVKTPEDLATEVIRIYPEISLEQEWQRQAVNLAKLFAEEVGQTEEQYIAALPKFEVQPKEYKGRLDIPVIVEARIPLKRMTELAGLANFFDVDSIKDWKKGKFEIPKTPYSTWLNDGTSNLNKSVNAVRKSLEADERGANIYDGIALYLKDPKILGNHYLDLPGSQVGSVSAPFLARWGGGGRGWTTALLALRILALVRSLREEKLKLKF